MNVHDLQSGHSNINNKYKDIAQKKKQIYLDIGWDSFTSNSFPTCINYIQMLGRIGGKY